MTAYLYQFGNVGSSLTDSRLFFSSINGVGLLHDTKYTDYMKLSERTQRGENRGRGGKTATNTATATDHEGLARR